MVQFTKLKLQGFKSFVERTEVDIGLGLTGIVGPNGCGKSNLVEALRWSMGESSSKKMRGSAGSMDQVIFNGTANRPSRNIAEVTVVLDNSDKSAPGPFTNIPEIEVVRKIERDHGSTYRINGKVVRTRDVQLLYADILSGANSPYLVSQGKITDIINAKPQNRKLILEEAAGITGLHARRHEAELKLRATDNNLKRLEDLLGSMDSRLQSLKRQARQANRYKSLSEEIRALEYHIAYLEHLAAYESLKEVETTLHNAEHVVTENLTTVTQLTKTQNTQAADLPELRQQDAELAAAVQSAKINLQRLEDEETRLEAQHTETQNQQEQSALDLNDTEQNLKEYEVSLERLTSEEQAIQNKQDNEDTDLEAQEERVAALKAKVNELEKQSNSMVTALATKRAEKQSLETQIEQSAQRIDSLKERVEKLESNLQDKQDKHDDLQRIESLKISLDQSENKLTVLKDEKIKAQAQLAELETKRDDLLSHKEEASEAVAKISTEINALQNVLQLDTDDDYTPVLDSIKTEEGFEAALSRAMGDFLMGSLDDEAPITWQKFDINLDDVANLPAGVQPLSTVVKTPSELALAVSQIGVVDTAEDGHAMVSSLKPGQSLVSKTGYYWRWDGLCIKDTATDRHSVYLQQKNRCESLEKDKPSLEKARDKANDAYNENTEQQQNIKDTLSDKDDIIRELESSIRDLRHERDAVMQATEARRTDIAKLTEALSLAKDDIKRLDDDLESNKAKRADYDDEKLDAESAQIEALKSELHAQREAYQDAAQTLEITRQDLNRKQARLRAIGDERVSLQNKCIRAKDRIKTLEQRQTELSDKLQSLKDRPKTLQESKQSLLDKLSAAEEKRAVVTDKLSSAETELAETTRALKEAEATLATAREKRAHAQATIEERQKFLKEVINRIEEQLGTTPQDLAARFDEDTNSSDDLNSLKLKREKLAQSRHSIGPVNLRAEQEAEELEADLGGVITEREDLEQAIAELREAIDKLNAEARDRLHGAFNRVNHHFKEIFTRLFHGGKAHLALIENEDPMASGLEIFAQPPGKTLQSLSLLSGGEQTLTAIALIFAMFMTNPSPICVLDEVDAPLDDANVDRFCDLLEEFAEKGETRFLVITHHRLTMARMDRLYGVTMAEKGVSQLVSVDINQQLDFLEEAA